MSVRDYSEKTKFEYIIISGSSVLDDKLSSFIISLTTLKAIYQILTDI